MLRAQRMRPSLYDDASLAALIVLWEASDRVCGKGLKAVISILPTAMERNGHETRRRHSNAKKALRDVSVPNPRPIVLVFNLAQRRLVLDLLTARLNSCVAAENQLDWLGVLLDNLHLCGFESYPQLAVDVKTSGD
jgi:hypothetical protein